MYLILNFLSEHLVVEKKNDCNNILCTHGINVNCFCSIEWIVALNFFKLINYQAGKKTKRREKKSTKTNNQTNPLAIKSAGIVVKSQTKIRLFFKHNDQYLYSIEFVTKNDKYILHYTFTERQNKHKYAQ